MRRTIIRPAAAQDERQIDQLFAMGELVHHPRGRALRVANAASPRLAPFRHETRKHANSWPGDGVLRVPEWKLHPWLVHGFSTRRGGVSTAYARELNCGEMNLGFSAGDSRENILQNRQRFLQAVFAGENSTSGGKDTRPLALLQQIHSGLIHHVTAPAQSGAPDRPLRGDGWIADRPGTWIGIQTADCLPILVADLRQRIVAAFHAGWRGTLSRIAERGVGRMRAEYGSSPQDLTAALGPGIGACCYSVGEDVCAEFASQFSYADALFQEVYDLDPIKQKYPMLFLTARAPGHSNLGPSTHLDLAEANRRQLQDAGIQPGQIHILGLCTSCHVDQFFSHRAESGFTGRMLSVIGVAG